MSEKILENMNKDKLILKYKGKDIFDRLPEFLKKLQTHEILEFYVGGKVYHIKISTDRHIEIK